MRTQATRARGCQHHARAHLGRVAQSTPRWTTEQEALMISNNNKDEPHTSRYARQGLTEQQKALDRVGLSDSPFANAKSLMTSSAESPGMSLTRLV